MGDGATLFSLQLIYYLPYIKKVYPCKKYLISNIFKLKYSSHMNFEHSAKVNFDQPEFTDQDKDWNR